MTNDDPFLREAAALGDQLVDQAVWTHDACSWPAHGAPLGAGAKSRALLGASVHRGTAGIAVFLARLSTFTDDHRHRTASLGALRHAIQRAWKADDGFMRSRAKNRTHWRFGFYSGTLGVAWAAGEVGQTLRSDEVSDEGRRLIRELAAADDGPHEFDLLLGAAGGIPALLRLASHGWPEARPLAERLGRNVLEQATVEGPIWSWRPPIRSAAMAPLTGWSHGASGIGWALAELYRATSHDAFRVAALGAFAYERSLFDPRTGTWPDFLSRTGSPDPSSGRATWCHGPPGIGVARVLAHPTLGDPLLLREAHVAAEATRRALGLFLRTPAGIFTPCCGIAGLAECLWIIEERLGVDGARDRARRLGLAGLSMYGTAGTAGPLSWPTGYPGVGNLSLMQGRAGIGWFLLRLHDPETVPTMLAPPLTGAGLLSPTVMTRAPPQEHARPQPADVRAPQGVAARPFPEGPRLP